MRAARERAGLTQEQVAERLNVSIHTFRRWDQGRNRPSSPEQMQLLAAALGAPIGVIWPATDDPLAAEALRLEEQRGVSPVRGPARGPASADPAISDADAANEIHVWRSEKLSAASEDDRAPDALASEVDAGAMSESVSPVEGAPLPVGEAKVRGAADEKASEAADGLPPWPGDEPDVELLSDQRAADPEVREPARPERLGAERSPAANGQPARAVGEGAATMLAARRRSGSRLRRVLTAVAAAAVIGGAGMVAASALGERAADADPSTTETAAAQALQREQERVEARARDVATMRAVADRGDYDAAIGQARQLDDPAAVSGYREAAARVLVGRAEKAARRGDLSLARSRLGAAKRRYGTAPGSSAVEARVRRIERQRKERAKRKRAAARRAAAALAAQRQAAANAARASEPPATTTHVPSMSSAPQSSAPAPSSQSSSSSSSSPGSGGGGGRKKEPEEAVDPGLF